MSLNSAVIWKVADDDCAAAVMAKEIEESYGKPNAET